MTKSINPQIIKMEMQQLWEIISQNILLAIHGMTGQMKNIFIQTFSINLKMIL